MKSWMNAFWLILAVLALPVQGPAAPFASVASRLSPTAVRSAERATFVKRMPYLVKLETALRSKGLNGDAQILAVFVNAWHESRFDANMGPERDSNGGTVAGILSLNSKGMGQGMSVAAMKSIEGTTNRLFSWPSMKRWVGAAKGRDAATVSNVTDLSVSFARRVMVCRSPGSRAKTAAMFAKAFRP